jgi:hypothetical protein
VGFKAELERRRHHHGWLRVIAALSAIPGVACLTALLRPGHTAEGYDSPRLAVFLTGSAFLLAAFVIGSVWWHLAGRDLARDKPSA